MKSPERMRFTLYVAGDSELSLAAIRNFSRLRQRHLSEDIDLVIIDVVEQPRRAREDRVATTPMLVRQTPTPIRKVLGDLSDIDRVADAMGLSSYSVSPESGKESPST